MNIRNANSIVKELRRRAGMTQEEFAADICSVQSLSRIETGKSGISYIMLKKFMEKAGINSNVYPAFRDKRDCDIFRKLYLCQRYIDVWMLEEAAQILGEVAELQYGDNRLHYQECLCYQCVILLKSGMEKEVNNFLEEAIKITRPEYHLEEIDTYWLSNTEIRLLLSLSYNYLIMGEIEICEKMIAVMDSCLDKLQAEEKERAVWKVKNGMIQAASLIKRGQFTGAKGVLKKWHIHAIKNKIYTEVPVILFLQGICDIHMGDKEKGRNTISNCYYSAKALGNSLADFIISYVQREFPDSITKTEFTKKHIVLPSMEWAPASENSNQNHEKNYYLGDFIRDVRVEKGIKQSVLCKGLCNKSTLSKIENNTLIPELEIMEALLQRLGIHTDAFQIYTNIKTYSFYELKYDLSAVVMETPKEEADRLFGLLLKTVNEKSAVQRQYVLYIWGMLEQERSKKQFLLREALYQTQPDFHIAYIQDFVFTFQEMMILIQIAKSLENNTTKAIFILYKLLEYVQIWKYETLEKVRIQKEIILVLSELLLAEKRFNEMKQIGRYIDNLLITGDYQSLSFIYENVFISLAFT